MEKKKTTDNIKINLLQDETAVNPAAAKPDRTVR